MAKKPVVLEVPGEVTQTNDEQIAALPGSAASGLAVENEALRKELEELKAAKAIQTTAGTSSPVATPEQLTSKPVLTNTGWVV